MTEPSEVPRPSYYLGVSCWHIVRDGHLLCGWQGDDFGIGGSWVDVIRSEMPVCRNCGSLTGRS